MTRHAQRWQTALAAIALASTGASCGGRAAQTAPETPEPRHAPETGLALDPPPAGRLDDAVLPRRASLGLDLDPRTPDFSGRVTIDVELTRPVSTIWLHGSALYLRRIALTAGTRELPLRRIECKEAGLPARCESATGAGLVGLALDEKVGPGPARIDIEYAGRLGTRNGLFRQEVDNVWYAFSDFEPTDARLAVPCFDDPRFKIPWQVSMRVPDGMRAFANAPEVSTRPAGKGWRRVEFAPTAPLPTYLLAFAAGPFDVLDGARQPVPMRVIATRGRAAEGSAALAAAAPMLLELERYLGSRTPFPKLDFLAVPTFNGAMENPGLITFAAPILLLQKDAAPGPAWRERHRLMAGVMAHELAHLWFGDQVTMRWWDELWLNEGLATWLSDRVMAAVYPADAGELLDVADKRQGLDIDRRGKPVPVRRAVDKPPDLGALFSPLTYRKGGAIVSMLEAYIGEVRMRDGLRRYLAAGAGGSVTTSDLAAALSAAAGRDLGPAMSSFLDQPGVPLVEASLECGRGRPSVSLRQSGYATLGSARVRAHASQSWQVPVCVAWQGGAAPACTLLAAETATLELPADRCPAWIHPNPGERGYYIYSLPPAQLRALAGAKGLTAREQAGLADDIDALLAAGKVPLDAALDALQSLARGPDPLTAQRAAETFELVARSLVGPRERRAFSARVRAAFGARARQLGLRARDGETTLDAQLRAELVPLVGRDGDDRVLQKEALRRLTRWLDQPGRDPLSSDEIDMLARVAPLAAGPELFDRVLAASGKPGQERVVVTLAGFRQPGLLERALVAVRERRTGPHTLGLLSVLLRDGATQDQALPLALADYPELVARLPEAERRRTAVVFFGVCRTAARAEVDKALRQGLAAGGQLPPVANAVLDAISSCAAFREHYLSAASRLQ